MRRVFGMEGKLRVYRDAVAGLRDDEIAAVIGRPDDQGHRHGCRGNSFQHRWIDRRMQEKCRRLIVHDA